MMRTSLKQEIEIDRRTTLGALVKAGAAAFFIPAWNESVEAQTTITCVPTTPTVTEGPYWVDEKLFRSDIRTDPATGVARAGIPLTLIINVQNLTSGSCTPLAGAYVDIWHCDAKGIYSDEPTYNPGGGTGNVNTSGQRFLRGYQITNADGQVTFTTIYPGWYSGRTIHIHVRVRTYNGTTVLSNFVSQIFFDEAVNNVVLATTSYSRTSARDTTNARDNIYNNQTRMLSTTTGDTSSGYVSTITMGAAFQVAAAAAPVVTTGGVGSAMSGVAGVSPGAWTSIYGSNFSTVTRLLAPADLSNDTIPTSLGGVSVQINGKAAFIHYVSPAQINILAPEDSSSGTVSVTVTNANGTSTPVSTMMSAIQPALATLSNYVRAVRYPDEVIVNGTGALEQGYTTTAAIGQGDFLALFGTGFGPTNSPHPIGSVFSGAYPTTNAVTVTIGGSSAEVLWSGLVGPGLYQINVRVPTSLGDGDHAVVASVAGLSSPSSTSSVKVMASAKLSTLAARLHRSFARKSVVNTFATGNRAQSLNRLMWLAGLHTPEAYVRAGCAPYIPGPGKLRV